MRKELVTTIFKYKPKPIDEIYGIALSIMTTVRKGVDDKRLGPRMKLGHRSRRGVESLGVLNQRPDMTTVQCMMHVKNWLKEEFGVTFDQTTRFKSGPVSKLTDEQMCACMAALDVICEVFTNRNLEQDLILTDVKEKAKKCCHAIRDGRTFSADAYEQGRLKAYDQLILGLPRPRAFNLLESAHVAEERETA